MAFDATSTQTTPSSTDEIDSKQSQIPVKLDSKHLESSLDFISPNQQQHESSLDSNEQPTRSRNRFRLQASTFDSKEISLENHLLRKHNRDSNFKTKYEIQLDQIENPSTSISQNCFSVRVSFDSK